MEPFKAFRIHADGGKVDARLETLQLEDLATGEVVIRGEYSSINYKDALAATGAGRILRKSPLVGGVDIAGTVVSSDDARIEAGQRVAVCGCGLSETHDGGFAEYARVRGDWVNILPSGLDPRTAMALGTAGFTAGLAIHAMERNGQAPGQGPIAVTGASGGVGSMAISMLDGLGYDVCALTSKADADDYLSEIGADEIAQLGELERGTRPLEKARWAGAIDNLGGEVLSWLTRTTRSYGNVASIGLAASAELSTSVMPFILRGVNLLGINSVETALDLRTEIWSRLATDLRPRALERIVSREVGLDELAGYFQDYVDGRVIGRTVVRLT